jgi:hypothetical protein
MWHVILIQLYWGAGIFLYAWLSRVTWGSHGALWDQWLQRLHHPQVAASSCLYGAFSCTNSLYMGLDDKYIVLMLTHHTLSLVGDEIPNSFSKVWIHVISVVVLAMAFYSVSVLPWVVFFADHDIRFEPKNITKPMVDILSSDRRRLEQV